MATAGFIIPLLFFLIQAADQAVDRWPNLYSQALEEYNRGNFNAARQTAEWAYVTWRTSPQSEWHWPFRLLLAESLIEWDHTAEALPLLSNKAPTPAFEARRLVALAFIRYRTAKSEETRGLLDAAAAINPKNAGDVAGMIEMIRGTLDLREEKRELAEACFRRALSLAPSGSLVQSYALTDLGVGDLRASRNDESTMWCQRSRELAQRAGMKRGVLLADSNLGVAYHRLGDLDLALKYFEESASLSEELGDRTNLLRVLINEGESELDLGDSAKAEEYIERARRLVAPGKDNDWVVLALVDLSMLDLVRGDSGSAAALNRAAGELADNIKDKRSQLVQKIQAGDIAAARKDYSNADALYSAAMKLAQELGDPVGQWQCHAGLASIDRATGRIADAEREYRLAIATIEDERSKLQHDDFKFSFLSHLIRFYDEYVDFLIARGDQAGAFRVAQSARGRLLAEKAQASGAQESALDLDSLQRTLRSSNSILLSYWLAPAQSLVWVLDGVRIQALPLPAESEISDRVCQYRDAISRSTNPVETSDKAGRWLFATLIPEPYRNRDGVNVFIQPDGALHQLNFESLPAGDGSRYWIESATVSIAPSLALLRPAANVPLKRLLMFGDPEAAKDLPNLPNLKAELDSVAKHYPEKQIYDGADATPAAYLNAHAETYSTLHFASHAVANSGSPLDSAIILAGTPETRKLYARDVLGHPLNAELVTLSACETAGNRAYYGEGLIGFSWAFLSAGARNVVAGLWQVDDRATALLMDRFYAALAAGRPPASALRQAKLELMASNPVYRKPWYWAAFETFTRASYR
jgi:CHAT domain-containing protein